jgi:hypothetical protein
VGGLGIDFFSGWGYAGLGAKEKIGVGDEFTDGYGPGVQIRLEKSYYSTGNNHNFMFAYDEYGKIVIIEFITFRSDGAMAHEMSYLDVVLNPDGSFKPSGQTKVNRFGIEVRNIGGELNANLPLPGPTIATTPTH